MQLELRIFGFELLVSFGKQESTEETVSLGGMITEVDDDEFSEPFGFAM